MSKVIPLGCLRGLLVEDRKEDADAIRDWFHTDCENFVKQHQGLSFEPIAWCSNIDDAKKHYSKLRAAGKQLHFVMMDYGLSGEDNPFVFLEFYIKHNPRGYWCWCTGNDDKVYPPTMRAHERLGLRMLNAFVKASTKSFTLLLTQLVERIKQDLSTCVSLKTNTVILTSRRTLKVVDGWVVREDKGGRCAFDDDLVPGFPQFDDAVLIHVPFMLAAANNFTDGIVDRGTMQDSATRSKVWVGRKGYRAWNWQTAQEFSSEFRPNNVALLASQFNVNLLWLAVASSKADWMGSLLARNGRGLDKSLQIVATHGQKAVLSRVGFKNFPAVFRPWAHVYQELNASAFWMEVPLGTTLASQGDSGSPRRAWRGETSMTIDRDAALYIDRGIYLYDVRTSTKIAAQQWKPTGGVFGVE
jgi:hypothetical protein